MMLAFDAGMSALCSRRVRSDYISDQVGDLDTLQVPEGGTCVSEAYERGVTALPSKEPIGVNSDVAHVLETHRS
jgi:hypothetical protein